MGVLDPTLHRFGPFLIVRTLGRGGMGEVFIARTPWEENPLAAVKRLRPDVARVPTFAERFAHEADLAVRLAHTHVVGTLDVGSVDGQLYVASVLVLGKDTGIIADRLRERGQGGPAAVAIRLLLDTLAGLGYVHGVREPDGKPLKLVHRDVTPGNVLVGYDGVARVADFGLAKSLLTEGSNLTNHGEILGTPHYLAPEVIRGESASPASDLYGLGAVMYRFLTGVAPHQGTTAEVLLKVLSEEVRPLSDLRPDLPPWLVAFVHRLLEKDPSRRPSDAQELLRQLQNDARASGLLVPRQAVGRWLGSLFEAEKGEELEERDRICQMDIEEFDIQAEGTVVLARPRAGSRLQGPIGLAGDSYDENQGTEIDLMEDEIHSAAAQIGGRPMLKSFELDTPGPSDVTDAARMAHHLGSLEVESDDGMPTRAVTVLPGLFGGEPNQDHLGEITGNVLDADTKDEPAQGNSDTSLPGFIDNSKLDAQKLESFAPAITNPEPDSTPNLLPRTRRSNPDSVVVSPAPLSSARTPDRSAPAVAAAAPVEEMDPTVRPRGPRVDPRSEPNLAPTRRRERPSGERPAINPPTPARARPSAVKPRARPTNTRRNLMLLVGLLSFAIAVGIGIGTLVAKIKSGDQSNRDLRNRFVAITTQIEDRQAKQQPIPPRVWQHTTDAAQALMDGNTNLARQNIEEAERLLETAPHSPGAAVNPPP